MIPAIPASYWAIGFGVLAWLSILSHRRTLRYWRLTSRREERLLILVLAQQELLKAGLRGELNQDSPEFAAADLASVQVDDEIAAQAALRTWQRIPPLGEEWPETFPRAELFG